MKAAAFVCASAVALAAALIGRDAAAAQDEQRTPPPSEAPQLAPTPATAASIDPTEAPDAARDRPPAPPPPDGAQALPPPPVAAPGEATGAATIADTVQAPQAKPGMGVSVGPIELKASGYFRAPLRLAFRSRGEGVPSIACAASSASWSPTRRGGRPRARLGARLVGLVLPQGGDMRFPARDVGEHRRCHLNRGQASRGIQGCQCAGFQIVQGQWRLQPAGHGASMRVNPCP